MLGLGNLPVFAVRHFLAGAPKWSARATCALWPRTTPATPPWATTARRAKSRTAAELLRRRKEKFGMNKLINVKELKASRPLVEFWMTMSVSDVADVLGLEVDEVFGLVLEMDNTDYIRNERQPIVNQEVFHQLSQRLKFRIKYVPDPRKAAQIEENLDVKVTAPRAEDLVTKPPVVTIMGHVDHGKTTLLDHLRKSRIVESEFGGITQHIGAFSVSLDKTHTVTFIDTPGHAAFKAMRSRGAGATDVVVLVVDACEGVLDQTLESVRMARESGAPIVVALNKIDKSGANVEAVKQQLQEAGLQLEDFGGDVQVVPISALRGTNVPKLIEAILTLAEVMQLKADFGGPVEGVVLESNVDSGLGRVATVLVQRGTLRKGHFLVCGNCWCKVRLLQNDQGKTVEEVTPAMAVRVMGWKETPSAGDVINQVDSEKRAQEVVDWRKTQEQKSKSEKDAIEIDRRWQEHQKEHSQQKRTMLEAGYKKAKYGRMGLVRPREIAEDTGIPKVSLLLRTDVDGSLEAIMNCLETYDCGDDCRLDIVDFGVGEVTDNDLMMARQFDAVIYAFNCRVTQSKFKEAADTNVQIRPFNVIYKLIDDLKEVISARLPPSDVEDIVGKALVQQEFLVSEGRQKIPVAGCRVVNGKLNKSSRARLLRDDVVVFDGGVTNLKHLKAEVNEVEQGRECGIMLTDSSVRFQQWDTIVFYQTRKEPSVTKWNPGF